MARPTTKRRLRDIDPDTFGRAIADRYMNHLVTLLGEYVRDSLRDPMDVLKAEALLLATYAKNGDGVSVVRAKVAYIAVRAMCDSTAHDADTDTVLLAARARLSLTCNEPVSVALVACLAGVDADHVRLLGRKGKLTIHDGMIDARTAREWLEARVAAS